MGRALLRTATERQLRIDLSKLYYNKTYFTFKEIAKLLKVGVKSSPYEKLNIKHLHYFFRKFGFHQRDPQNFKYVAKPKKVKKVEKTIGFYTWKRNNRLKVIKMWDSFDGSWKEFEKKLHKQFCDRLPATV